MNQRSRFICRSKKRTWVSAIKQRGVRRFTNWHLHSMRLALLNSEIVDQTRKSLMTIKQTPQLYTAWLHLYMYSNFNVAFVEICCHIETVCSGTTTVTSVTWTMRDVTSKFIRSSSEIAMTGRPAERKNRCISLFTLQQRHVLLLVSIKRSGWRRASSLNSWASRSGFRGNTSSPAAGGRHTRWSWSASCNERQIITQYYNRT